MELKPGYRRTEVGIIPQDWSLKRVRELGTVFTGGTPSTAIPIYWNGDHPWVTPTDISAQRDISESQRMISSAGLRTIRPLPANSVLVTCIASIGKNAILRKFGSCNQQINAVVPCEAHSSEYLFYMFEAAKGYLLANAGTTATSIVSKAVFEQLMFAVPNPSEQRAIATALSDVDALISKLDQVIAKKRAIKQAVMQQLLTGKTRLPGFSGEWEVVALGEILTLIADYTANGSFESLRLNVTYFQEENYAALVRTTDLEKQPFSPERFTDKRGYDFLGKTALVGGEIVIANVGSVGKAYRVPHFFKPMTLAPNTYLLRFDQERVSDDYISQWMQSQDFVKKILGKVGSTTLLAINKDNLRSIVTSCPPLPEQTAIASILLGMDAEISALEARRDKTHAIKQGMMEVLLTGQVRLPVNPEPSESVA